MPRYSAKAVLKSCCDTTQERSRHVCYRECTQGHSTWPCICCDILLWLVAIKVAAIIYLNKARWIRLDAEVTFPRATMSPIRLGLRHPTTTTWALNATLPSARGLSRSNLTFLIAYSRQNRYMQCRLVIRHQAFLRESKDNILGCMYSEEHIRKTVYSQV